MTTPTGARPPGAPQPERDADEIRRHEAHLVAQIYYLIEQNHRLEEQLDRLAKVTEIAKLFRQRKISRDTFELPPLRGMIPSQAEQAWADIAHCLEDLPQDHAAMPKLRDALGMVRAMGWQADPDWLAEARGRLLAAEQAIAFLDEQSREMDLLKNEKANIQDGANRLEQTVEDLWKSLHEKTTHIQGLEAEVRNIKGTVAYRTYRWLTKPLRGGRP